MPAITNFRSDPEALHDLLQSTKEGETQLPDFQRSWVWNDEQIRSILASISLSYPVGVVMMLETGNPDVRFKTRPIEGVTLSNPIEAKRLILDGQQRLTSLVQSLLLGKPVITKDARGKKVHRWYYIDIVKALAPNFEREEAILSLPEDKIIRNFRGVVEEDYSTPEKEYHKGLFPLAQIFDYAAWRRGYNILFRYNEESLNLFDRFEEEVIDRFKQYRVPVILLRKETPREAVCQVFEKVNTGGVSLTVFELITATFAADKFNLREDWDKREKELKKYQVLRNIQNTDFLQAVTLCATSENPPVSCKRKDVLKLSLLEYQNWANSVTQGFKQAAELLHTQKIFTDRDLPYQTQLTALAAILAALVNRANNAEDNAKLIRWYWCGVFGELYGSAIESRLANDFQQVLEWIKNNGSEPVTIRDANFAASRLQYLYTRRSAAYKGLSALLLRDGGCDFHTGYPIDTLKNFDHPIDIHHIFPRHWCQKNGIKSEFYDSVINKTPLSAKTNRQIGSNAPSIYLLKIQKETGICETKIDEILRSHVIDPVALRADDFDAFFQARQKALLERIEKAMGKNIVPVVDLSDRSDDPEQDEYDNDLDNDDDLSQAI
ncbi:GmrSD restriction endonuclease domain-containing protein [Argonema galeatum]|uniref:GmrSD restriction endonuclease domain-containing protein n=1 Tax=Argonema galeatum TaxID=2942762 RepID=UPI00201259B7|nr:DUF262 domain-containing protein [Argonema galeatum]MCL1467560.1 DUF262 domain-containing protein [Argonema galeatum A003/A1]